MSFKPFFEGGDQPDPRPDRRDIPRRDVGRFDVETSFKRRIYRKVLKPATSGYPYDDGTTFEKTVLEYPERFTHLLIGSVSSAVPIYIRVGRGSDWIRARRGLRFDGKFATYSVRAIKPAVWPLSYDYPMVAMAEIYTSLGGEIELPARTYGLTRSCVHGRATVTSAGGGSPLSTILGHTGTQALTNGFDGGLLWIANEDTINWVYVVNITAYGTSAFPAGGLGIPPGAVMPFPLDDSLFRDGAMLNTLSIRTLAGSALVSVFLSSSEIDLFAPDNYNDPSGQVEKPQPPMEA